MNNCATHPAGGGRKKGAPRAAGARKGRKASPKGGSEGGTSCEETGSFTAAAGAAVRSYR